MRRYEVTVKHFWNSYPLVFIEIVASDDFEIARQTILERYRHAYQITIMKGK